MSYSKKTLSGKSRKKYLKYVKNLKKELNSKIETKEVQFNIKPFKSYYSLDRNTTIKSWPFGGN